MSGSTTPITLTCAGKLETYTVPITGLYTITAYGAQRGSKGAEIGGDVVLTRGEMLQVAVGGRGNDGAGGVRDGAGLAGGHGTLVIGPGN